MTIGTLEFRNNAFIMSNAPVFIGFSNISFREPALYCTADNTSTVATSFNDNEAIINYGFTSNMCLGEHSSQMVGHARSFNHFTSVIKASEWFSTYVPGRTDPYRHPGQVLFGLPRNIPNWYLNVHDASPDACHTLISNNYYNRNRTRQVPVNNNTTRILDHVSDENLRALTTNHCNDCHFKNDCAIDSYITDHVANTNDSVIVDSAGGDVSPIEEIRPIREEIMQTMNNWVNVERAIEEGEINNSGW